MASKKLYRSCKDRLLGGVCAGIGNYFDVDPVLIRLLFIVFIAAGGLSFIVYLIAWVIIPSDPSCGPSGAKEEIKTAAENVASNIKEKGDDGRYAVGFIVLIIGILLLLRNITGARFWNNFWPLILIILGLFVIFRSGKDGK